MSDLVERLRRSALQRVAENLGSKTGGRPPDWGRAGACGGEVTVPIRVPVPTADEHWASSQCARCDWWSGTRPGSVIQSHERVWRDERGALV